ncbi:MAG: glycosyltransferase family 2 protein [Phycisphaerae bacterium]|nr:glycosyltransferase family 2 protein [Phycisphaerae bacterium]
MYKEHTVCVVVPAYNEEKLIGRVLETMPGYVDKIVVVDDKSADNTAKIVREAADKSDGRIILIQHDENQGVGGAIVSGYKWACDNKMFATAVMAGDAQMDPEDLPTLLEPVVNGEIDYAKGNRLFTGNAWNIIPKVRYLGNSFLSLLTKIASGYWHIADSQTGYTVINLRSLELIDIDKIYKRYGMPNDLLVKLNIYNLKVRDVPVKPVYNIGEKSGIKIHQVVPKLSWLLFKCFLYRVKEKYIIRDFHPLVFFYLFGFFFGLLTIILFARLFVLWFVTGHILPMNALAAMFSFMSTAQFTLFAMWFDMESNKELK